MDDGMNVTAPVQENGILKELLDSKYPLLQEFREKCPGTHKHSQALASMIEGVAMELGLDEDYLKVAALYHDVGKMYNPICFTENQSDQNMHDGLDPVLSYEMITRHVSDSVMILINDTNFPRDIIEIISQHHGNTILKYFYQKAKNGEKDPEKIEIFKSKFRYKTTRPASIEAMVLMVCDNVEATSRSLAQANKFTNAKDVIKNVINGLIDDGQFDEVTMKLGDLKRIKLALEKEMQGVYQKRVDYEEVDEDNEE